MSGLPDEAVEAMASAMRRMGRARGTWLGFSQAAKDALAALPAGVYVSDGQGNVRPGRFSVDVVKDVIDGYVASCREVSEPIYTEEMAEQVLAALSATDTEKK